MAVPLVTPAELATVLDWPDGSDDTELLQICSAADRTVRNYLDPSIDHDAHANDREAAMAVAIQILQSRIAPGGQRQANDFSPVIVPHLLGPGLVARVMGLIGQCRKYGGLVVG